MQHYWEMHAHTSTVSPCGQVSPEDLAEAYIGIGYTGVVVTDHLFDWILQQAGGCSWKEKVRWYMSGYRAVKAAAGDRLKVLFGAELRFPGDVNDYLVYGMTEEWLIAHPNIMTMNIKEFSELSRENGFLLIQAHPFRNDIRVVPPQLLDGIEVFNGNKRHDSRNIIARQWAERYHLPMVSGSDFHMMEDLGRGGIYTERDVETVTDLIAAVREGVGLKCAYEDLIR